MADFPNEIRYVETHEWVRIDDGQAVVGISDHAQDALGDVVYVELPDIGATVGKGDEIAVVESVKAASDIYAPLAGSVVAVNQALEDSPELVNESPYGKGWFFTIAVDNVADADALLTAQEYQQICEADG